MKIYKDEKGRICIDGEYHTFLCPEADEKWLKAEEGIEIGQISHMNIQYPSSNLESKRTRSLIKKLWNSNITE